MTRVALALAGLIALGWAAPAARAAGETVAPALTHLEWRCELGGRSVGFEELKLESGRGLELRAGRNAGARPDARCRDGYGGPDLESWLKAPPRELQGFEILGATNGTVFRVAGRGYASNQLLWSKGAGLIAGLRAMLER